MGSARDCANGDTSVYPGSGPSRLEVNPYFLAYRRTWRIFFCGSPPCKRRVAWSRPTSSSPSWSPACRRSHKMCFLGSARDPTRHSSKSLSALEVARKVNRIADVKLQASWTWGLEPHDRDNPIAEVSSSDLAPILLPLCDSDLLISVYLVRAELVCPAGGGEFDPVPSRLCR
jgi:hypothetical protein